MSISETNNEGRAKALTSGCRVQIGKAAVELEKLVDKPCGSMGRRCVLNSRLGRSRWPYLVARCRRPRGVHAQRSSSHDTIRTSAEQVSSQRVSCCGRGRVEECAGHRTHGCRSHFGEVGVALSSVAALHPKVFVSVCPLAVSQGRDRKWKGPEGLLLAMSGDSPPRSTARPLPSSREDVDSCAQWHELKLSQHQWT